MRILQLTLLAASVAMAAPAAARGQTAPIVAGDRVRAVIPGERGNPATYVDGIFQSASADSVVLRRLDNGQAMTVPAGDGGYLEEFAGRGRGSAGTGALVGLGIGALLGAALGSSGSHGCQGTGPCFSFDPGPGADAAGGALVIGALGAGLGAIIGASSHHDRWVRAPWPGRARPFAVRSGHGVGLGLSLRL